MRLSRFAVATALALLLPACAGGQDGNDPPTASTSAAARGRADTPAEAVARLEATTGGAVEAALHRATGARRFVRVPPGQALDGDRARDLRAKQKRSQEFFRDFGAAVGVGDPAGMRFVAAATDRLGETHLTWRQHHAGLPVFAGTVKTHFDASDRLKVVGGTALPDVAGVSPIPLVSKQRAGATAREWVRAERGDGLGLRVGPTQLLYFREGLARGVPGPTHLAWEIEVGDSHGIRDRVYVSAHTGKVIDRLQLVHDDLFRRAYDGHSLPNVPVNYPNGIYWDEGDHFPTAFVEANNMIVASQETYDFFFNAFGRDSLDDAGLKMDSIFNRGYQCPNASWNGVFISFCPGFTTDDVTAHEWGHGYTQYTHDLIYQWQPGALNESYSDIWGETIDIINGRGLDAPSAPRTAGECSTFSPPVGKVVVLEPASIAGDKFAQSAGFGEPLDEEGITNEVVAALDGDGNPNDGCTEIVNPEAIEGKIALIDRGTCEFSTKVLRAQEAGAIAVIIANNVATGLPGMGPGVDAPSVTIPSVGVQQATGNDMRAALMAGPVTATLLAEPGADESFRWLMGEEVTGFGALRDMWNPTCYANAGKVSDTAFYFCDAGDNGGVHFNSGIPNHAYALLVEGGDYNGQSIQAIGLTKAAHIYFRAQSVYQVQDSDFADHADALEQSCADLTGAPLNALTGGPSNEVITEADCQQVANAIAAVELRLPPNCNFPPLLNPGNSTFLQTCHPLMTTGVTTPIASFDFESGAQGFAATHAAASSLFTERDFTLVSLAETESKGDPFDGPSSFGAGMGWFGPTPRASCNGVVNETGMLFLTSPPIVLPEDAVFARANFEHWFGLEPGFDGGNVSISVNGGPFVLVPPSQFTFNNYLFLLFSAAQGNTNPIAGQATWTTTRAGDVEEGTWGRSFFNIGNFAAPGDTIQLRWNLGTDVCAGRAGWYLDNVNVYSCGPNVPTVNVLDAAFDEGDSGTQQVTVSVRASVPTIRAVSVAFVVQNGTAQNGNDLTTYSGVVTIPASSNTAIPTTALIPVTIKGDKVSEGDETFTVRLIGVANATIGDGEATVTIVDDDAPVPDDET